MLEDIITGENDPEHLASPALGHLRVKIPQLRLLSSVFAPGQPRCSRRNPAVGLQLDPGNTVTFGKVLTKDSDRNLQLSLRAEF
jgi:hypothetical protein